MSAGRLAVKLTRLSTRLAEIERTGTVVALRAGDATWYPRGYQVDGKGQPDIPKKLSGWIVRLRAALVAGGRAYKGYVKWLDALVLDRLGLPIEELPYTVPAELVEEMMWATNSLLEGLRFLLDALNEETREAARIDVPGPNDDDPFWPKEYAAKLLGVKVKTLIGKVCEERKRKGVDFPWVARAGRRRDFQVNREKFVEWMNTGRRPPGRPRAGTML